jgi:hypothetical protein
MSRIHAAHVEGHFGADASDTLLFAAVYLGMFEKRLMNASKLADYVGAPRSTMDLEELKRLGRDERRGTTEVPLFNEINSLAQGEGEISPLRCKGYFEGAPHPDRRITARVSCNAEVLHRASCEPSLCTTRRALQWRHRPWSLSRGVRRHRAPPPRVRVFHDRASLLALQGASHCPRLSI